jgi:hypothetical protein
LIIFTTIQNTALYNITEIYR